MLRELVDRFAYRYRLWAGETQGDKVGCWRGTSGILPRGLASLKKTGFRVNGEAMRQTNTGAEILGVCHNSAPLPADACPVTGPVPVDTAIRKQNVSVKGRQWRSASGFWTGESGIYEKCKRAGRLRFQRQLHTPNRRYTFTDDLRRIVDRMPALQQTHYGSQYLNGPQPAPYALPYAPMGVRL